MIVVNNSEFRASMRRYMDLAWDGKDVVVMSRDSRAWRVVPVFTDGEGDLPVDFRQSAKELASFKRGELQLQSLDDLINEL